MRSASLRATAFLALVAAIAFCATDFVLANGSVRETEYSTSLTEATGIALCVNMDETPRRW